MNYPRVDNSGTNLTEPAGESDLDLTSIRYAEELRAVGQALEAQSRFVSVEIEAQGSGYWVRAAVEESKNADKSFGAVLKRIFRSLVQSDKQTTSPTIELRYSAEETKKLVQNGQVRRHDTNAAPDPFSLSHTLRTAGAYIDGLGQATLIGLAVKDCWITIRYKNASGQIKELKQDIQFFYDYWVKMYLRRKNRSASMPSPTNATYKTALKER
jgi:hypothetical protein